MIIINYFNNFLSFFYDSINEATKYVFYYPLKTLYFYGPSFGNYGFWNGKYPHDICSQLTMIPSYTWSQKELQGECNELLEKHFHSFYIGVLFVGYTYTFYVFLQYIWYRFFIWKPFLIDVKNLLETSQVQKNLQTIDNIKKIN
jgi:hypothetical protein